MSPHPSTSGKPYRYPCTWEGCTHASQSQFDLRRHIRVHTGEKPYKCPVCGNGFPQKSAMTSHVKTVHLKIKDKRCNYPDCGKVYGDASSLSRHKKRHSYPAPPSDTSTPDDMASHGRRPARHETRSERRYPPYPGTGVSVYLAPLVPEGGNTGSSQCISYPTPPSSSKSTPTVTNLPLPGYFDAQPFNTSVFPGWPSPSPSTSSSLASSTSSSSSQEEEIVWEGVIDTVMGLQGAGDYLPLPNSSSRVEQQPVEAVSSPATPLPLECASSQDEEEDIWDGIIDYVIQMQRDALNYLPPVPMAGC